jgi:hypothetical protein
VPYMILEGHQHMKHVILIGDTIGRSVSATSPNPSFAPSSEKNNRNDATYQTHDPVKDGGMR